MEYLMTVDSMPIQADCVCIDLCEAIGNFIDIEEVFPKDKYEH